MQNNKIELLAPAGNFEKLEAAVHFGADAVYIGGKNFSLRSHSGNFTVEEIARAADFTARNNVRLYVACNAFARNNEQKEIYRYLEKLGKIGPDALIIADPGVFMAAKSIATDIPIHISTQANTTSILSARFWAQQGAARINAARELTLAEIKEIASSVPIGVEAFVHGAMCIAWSGRCLLSHYLAQRDGNRGLCAHACRWKYHLVEEARPGQYIPVVEDDRGAYFFSSKDLCMIENLPEMIDTGITSLKIEGRMKGINYLAATVKTYRQAIDAFYEDPGAFFVDENWRKELESVNYRGYSTGFYMNDPAAIVAGYEKTQRKDEHRYIGKIVKKNGGVRITIDVKNRILQNAAVEIIDKTGTGRPNTVMRIETATNFNAPLAQPNTRATLHLASPDPCIAGDIVRTA